MSPATITLIFLTFAILLFVTEKIPLGLTSMVVCIGLVVTGVLNVGDAFSGFINSNVILFVAMFIVGGALFETGMANEIGSLVTKFAKTERGRGHHGDCGRHEWISLQHRYGSGFDPSGHRNCSKIGL